MIEIRKQDYETVQEFKDDIIDRFASDQGQPFGYEEFAFEALASGTRVGTINGYRLYDWLYVEFLAVSEGQRGAMWALASFPPEPAEIVKPVSKAKFDN